jgi:hypothetical protein
MGMIRDVLSVVKEVLLLSYRIDDLCDSLDELTAEVRNHDRRLIRIETMI